MLDRTSVVIESIDPLEGAEGSIITLRGSGFASHVRNNCVVVGGMGACARAQPGATDSELKVRIGAVPRTHVGDILMWAGVGLDIHTDHMSARGVDMDFSEVAIFRNGTEVASFSVEFRLTEALLEYVWRVLREEGTRWRRTWRPRVRCRDAGMLPRRRRVPDEQG